MNRHVRILPLRLGRSIAYLKDALHCLPPDTILTHVQWDVSTGDAIAYLVHPEFSETPEYLNLPRLEPIEETRSRISLSGVEYQSFIIGIKDLETGKFYKPE